ncbi:MAG: cache domain-containing protein [Alteromonadaceae bacterium]|nr:cache domain-containing protein [Alteromonadaceae bacterium]
MSFLNNFKIRTRLLIGIVLPVLMTAGIIAWITASQIQANGEAELERLERELLDTHKTGLKNLVESAHDIMLEAKENSWSEEEAKTRARERMRSITFDETNYVFVYDRELNNLAYAPDPSKEGPTTTPSTRKLLRNIFQAAERNGFHDYEWTNPATGNTEPKVSYAMIIPEWDWMVGAGVY